jgi:hypothetical protein
MWSLRKTSPRRNQLRKTLAAERFSHISQLINIDVIISVLLWLLFVVLCIPILSIDLIKQRSFSEVIPLTIAVLLVSVAGALYIHHYQGRIIKNHARAVALAGLFILLLATTKLGLLATHQPSWATGTAITAAIILTVAYSQRFAIGMTIFYCFFACFAAGQMADIRLLLTMAAGGFICCLSLKEIRTRLKLLKVSITAAAVVFVMAVSVDFLLHNPKFSVAFADAGWHAAATIFVGLLIQSLLPLIEKVFRIATSMTLLDYTDANQPLLKRLAMEAPGTFSHSLLIGSVAEAAAEAIGRNGLLCRVGAYYHDIGKINKPGYFVENELGPTSRHKELSPAMSQLIIVGHVKDGIELVKEYGLPTVLRQFIETHHGTTLVEYFYNAARKKQDEKSGVPSESEFRYAGPKPRTKEAAIVMLADAVEGAVRALPEVTPTKIETVVHNMAMKRLQDGQFDECDLSLRELSQIETSMSKTLVAHYHGRIQYPTSSDMLPRHSLVKEPKTEAIEDADSQPQQPDQNND